MLRSMHDLQDYTIGATDGTIGHVKDFYFDDQTWVVRYLLVDTGHWLSSRMVLISPISIGHPNWTDKLLPVAITKEQVRNSPGVDTEKPVSRHYEMQYLGYYGYPFYWGGGGLWGAGGYPNMMMPGYPGFISTPNPVLSEAEKTYTQTETERRQDDDLHLRSCKSVIGYHVGATDGDIGHVAGMLVEEQTWAIRYFIVDTSNWWLGHQVLIAPKWISDVSWAESTVSVSLTRQAVKDAPAYDPSASLSREQESDIHRHYGRSVYWEDEIPRQGNPLR